MFMKPHPLRERTASHVRWLFLDGNTVALQRLWTECLVASSPRRRGISSDSQISESSQLDNEEEDASEHEVKVEFKIRYD